MMQPRVSNELTMEASKGLRCLCTIFTEGSWLSGAPFWGWSRHDQALELAGLGGP
jgi:hypothetical protein